MTLKSEISHRKSWCNDCERMPESPQLLCIYAAWRWIDDGRRAVCDAYRPKPLPVVPKLAIDGINSLDDLALRRKQKAVHAEAVRQLKEIKGIE